VITTTLVIQRAVLFSLHPSPAANVERTQSGNRFGFGNFDMIDSRGARTFAQTLMQVCQLLLRSVGQHLHGAVGIIADPSCDLQDVRFALNKPAEADALNAAANQKAASMSGMIFCGSHRLIAEVKGKIAEVKILSCNHTPKIPVFTSAI
jgi:hypothetical protein